MMLTALANATESESPSQRHTKIGLAVVLFALLVRGSVCFWDVTTFAPDPDAYQAIAKTLARTGVFGLTAQSGQAVPTAFRPPLYPYALSWLLVGESLSLYGIAAFHTLLGCVTVWCTYMAGLRLFGATVSIRCSILAACLVIVDPILLQQSRLVMTETLAAAIASVVVWWWVWYAASSPSARHAVALGILLSLAFLCRPTFLVWAGMLCLGIAIAAIRAPLDRQRRIRLVALVGSMLVITVAAWMLRNARAIGYPVWATTHGGYTLLLGNNPLFYDYLREGPAGTTWDTERFFIAYAHRYHADPTTENFWNEDWSAVQSLETAKLPANFTEHDDDRLVCEAAKATIRREPAMFLWSCGIRVARLWSPFPHHTSDRPWAAVVLVGTYYSMFYLAIAIGLWKLGRDLLHPNWWPALTLVATLTLVHAVYWSNIRMRAPAMPSLAIVAAAATGRPEQRD